MNWKKRVGMFCNRQFDLMINGEVHTWVGFQFKKNCVVLESYAGAPPLIREFTCIKKATLIARRIRSLTEEEMKVTTLGKSLVGYDVKMFLEVCAQHSPNRMNALQMLSLCELGIFPGDQLYFELPDDHPEKVIDVATL